MNTDLSNAITQTMTLKEIVDLLNQNGEQIRHFDAMKVVERMAKSHKFGTTKKSFFEIINHLGAVTNYPTFALDKRQSIAVAAKLNTTLLMAVIDRWQALEKSASRPTKLPYHIRRYLENAPNVPKGHFAILPEMCNRIIFPLDRVGYHMPESMLPDISFGLMFCKELRRLGHDTSTLPTY